jgi:hypothetical protein
MWAKRFGLLEEQELEAGKNGVGAFVAMPAMMGVAAFQQQLYHWAYEQAKQSAQICRPAPMHDLFAVMN